MRDIGPDMLRHFDQKLAAGEIDRATYEARRRETLKLIRRGEAVEYTVVERLVRASSGVLITLLGFLALQVPIGTMGDGIGVVLIGAGVWLTVQRLRR